MSDKQKNNTIYACLSIKDFNLHLFTTKNQVADTIGCHRNTLNDIKDKFTYGDFIVFTTTLSKCKRGVR